MYVVNSTTTAIKSHESNKFKKKKTKNLNSLGVRKAKEEQKQHSAQTERHKTEQSRTINWLQIHRNRNANYANLYMIRMVCEYVSVRVTATNK